MAVTINASVGSATGTGTTATGAFPAGVAVGDHLRLFIMSTSITTHSTPVGWTRDRTAIQAGDFEYSSYKTTYTAGMAAPVSTLGASTDWAIDMVAISGADPVSPVNNHATSTTLLGSTITNTVAPSVADGFILSWAAASTTSSARTWTNDVGTELWESGLRNGLQAHLVYRQLTGGSGASTSVAHTISGSTQDLGGFVVAVAPAPPPPPAPGVWALAYSNDFATLEGIATSWFGGSTMNNVTTDPANVAIVAGQLVLTLSSTTVGALVNTNPHDAATNPFEFRYGYAEARIWFPGSGTDVYNFPAWWTNGQNNPADGEHDIAEGLGTMTVNYHSPTGAHNQGTVPGTWTDGFHTFGLHRKPGSADVYYDGVLVKSYATDDSEAPHYLIINAGYNASRTTVVGVGSQVKVEWVRVWTPVPATALTVQASSVIAGTTIAYVAASAAGNSFPPSDRGYLLVRNGGGSPMSVTVGVPGMSRHGQPNPDVVVTVPAGASKAIGPFPSDLADPVTGLVGVTYSAVTSVTVAYVGVSAPL